jgi:threonine dehydrogenase-like Zn-dependent dehydrogenase
VISKAYAGLDLAALRDGQNVVIQDAGGLGVYACAVAREMGAGRVIVIDGVDERLALACQFGADETVDLREHPASEARIKHVRALTDDGGGDIQGAGHIIVHDKPEEFERVVLDFLRRHKL